MSKISMITSRDGEYSQAIKPHTDGQRYPAYSRPERQHAASMQKNKLGKCEVVQAFTYFQIRAVHPLILACRRIDKPCRVRGPPNPFRVGPSSLFRVSR